MHQLLQILTAMTLVFPLGLLEYSPCWKEFASLNSVEEELPAEDSDAVSRLELDKQRLFSELLRPLGFTGPALPIFLLADSWPVDRQCVEMRGSRPPPGR